jgi:multidrug resistance efflux pump
LFFISSATKDANLLTALQMANSTKALTGKSSPVIKALYTNLASAELKVKNDSLQFIRYKNLYEQDAISKSSFEKWQQQYLTAQQEKWQYWSKLKVSSFR